MCDVFLVVASLCHSVECLDQNASCAPLTLSMWKASTGVYIHTYNPICNAFIHLGLYVPVVAWFSSRRIVIHTAVLHQARAQWFRHSQFIVQSLHSLCGLVL